MSEEQTPDPKDFFPEFPEESISIYLNIYRDWHMSLDRGYNITHKSRLTHPDFPGISLSTEEFYGNDKFDLLIAKIYKQAVAYGKAQEKKSQKIAKAKAKAKGGSK